ncbi:MAG: SDR family oxidoreductase, partial [Bdellovibrionales bacterium]
MQKSALVTGATGLLGSWLVGALLSNSDYQRIYALARGSSRENARQRVLNLLHSIPNKAHRNVLNKLIVLEGDVTKQNLGIKKLSNVIDDVTDIFHGAAIAEFGLPLKKIRPTNVLGTKNVFELAVRIKKRRPSDQIRVHHIST